MRSHPENPVLAGDAKTGPFDHVTEGTARIRLFVSVAIEANTIEEGHQEGAQERIPAIGYADDRHASGPQDAEDLLERRVRLGEVFDRPHGIHHVEAGCGERQRPYVGDEAVQRQMAVAEVPARSHDGRSRDIHPERFRSCLGGPAEDAGVLGLIPEIGLENPAAVQRRQVAAEEPLFVFEVLRGRARAAKIGKVSSDVGREIIAAGAAC